MKNQKFILQTSPFRVPTSDGKLIEEHFGRASAGGDAFSLAHMIAPPGWGEPFQTPEFDELTFLISGKKQIEIDGTKLVVAAGQSILVKKGVTVRYSNPFAEPAEYWSVCLPAFSPDTVHRQE